MILRNMNISQEYEIFVDWQTFVLWERLSCASRWWKILLEINFAIFSGNKNVNKQESTTFFFNHMLGYSKLFLLTISRNLRTFQHKDYHRYLVCIFLNLN